MSNAVCSLAAHKHRGPTTCLTFLGKDIDTLAGSLGLPEGKLQHLTLELDDWGDRKPCTKKELESLMGAIEPCMQSGSPRSHLPEMND